MRIVVFGATGRTGREVVALAAANGHRVVAVTRSPTTYAAPAGVDVHAADVGQPDTLDGLFHPGDAVISAIGPDDGRRPTTVYSDGVHAMINAMGPAGAGRLVVISAVPVSPDTEKTTFERLVLHPILWRFFGPSYLDLRRMETRLQATDDPSWAVVRPPRLTDQQPGRTVRMEWDAPLRRPSKIGHRALAQVLLDVATAEPFRSGVLTVSE